MKSQELNQIKKNVETKETEKIIVTKTNNKKINLKKKLENNHSHLIEEYDWGTPKGKEIW
jgi:antitoxin component of MazEF toxin-antitoxin module